MLVIFVHISSVKGQSLCFFLPAMCIPYVLLLPQVAFRMCYSCLNIYILLLPQVAFHMYYSCLK